MKDKKYKVIAFMPMDVEEQEPLTMEEAQAEKEQCELMQPENIYKIIDTETDEEIE